MYKPQVKNPVLMRVGLASFLTFVNILQAGQIIDFRGMINDATRLNVEEGAPDVRFTNLYLFQHLISLSSSQNSREFLSFYCVSGSFTKTSVWIFRLQPRMAGSRTNHK